MGTALFTGVTALLAHQRRLDVVANNIANVNTVGYRGSRVIFQDLLSQTIEGGSPAVNGFGGTDPKQIGLGVEVGSIAVNQGQGSLFTTGVSSDLAIEGNGFFVLTDGVFKYYTRDGSFGRNADGVLVDPASGMRVQGYQADANGNIDTNNPITDIVIQVGTTAIVQATQNANMIGNLDSNAAEGAVVERAFRVYDSLGTARDIKLTFTKRAQVTDGGTAYNAWLWKAEFGAGNDVTNVNSGESGVILFDTSGVFHDEGSIDNGATDTFKPRSTLASQNEVSIPASLITGGALPVTPFEFNIGFGDVTNLGATSDVSLNTQDGFPRGLLADFAVGGNGVITGSFTNGLTQVIGQIALANFGNVGGLSRSGSNMFLETPSSGVAQIGLASTGGRGSISGGSLEGSNVDLGTEFSNLIVTERGFQANARIITAADTLLQEAVNLVR
jgi:flagellar hook protein FlgE